MERKEKDMFVKYVQKNFWTLEGWEVIIEKITRGRVLPIKE